MKTKNFLKIIIYIFLTLFVNSCTDKTENVKAPKFDTLVKYIKDFSRRIAYRGHRYDSNFKYLDTSKIPIIAINQGYKIENNYSIEISSNPINFDLRYYILNPKNNKRPNCASVIYKCRLITLFDSNFVAHDINNMRRDYDFENQIPKRKFYSINVISGKLVGKDITGNYILNDNNKWINYNLDIPLNLGYIFYEDSTLVVYLYKFFDGFGYILFFEKQTRDVYVLMADYPKWLYKTNSGYRYFSGRVWGMSVFEIKNYRNYTKYKLVDFYNIKDFCQNNCTGFRKEDFSNKKYDDLNIVGGFLYQGRELILFQYASMITFIGEMQTKKISVVNPLFNAAFSNYFSSCKQYGDITLLSGYGSDERGCIIINSGRITKIDWGKSRTIEYSKWFNSIGKYDD